MLLESQAPTDDFEIGPISEEEWAEHRRSAVQSLPPSLEGQSLPSVLLKHQTEILASTSRYAVTATDKSRRVGATWGVGADAVLTAGAQTAAGGMDVLYIGYNLDMAREFIDTCAMWARAFMPACTAVGDFLFHVEGDRENPDQFIQAFRIRFASGFEIVALSSRPRSLRGRQGYVILDEFAFHDDPEGLLKACMALLIWGGKILVISTHNGVDNPFNKLIQDILAGRLGPNANVVRCTFDDAILNGLYKRVCLKKGIAWTPEGEAEWRANIRKIYGENAAEELDCVPSQGTGSYLTRATIERATSDELPVIRLRCPPGFERKDDYDRQSFIADFLRDEVGPHLKTFDRARRSFLGQDFARTGDVSPVAFGQFDDRARKVCRFILEMRNVPFTDQEFVLNWLIERVPLFAGGKMDARGNGSALAEKMQQKWGFERIEAVMASAKTYLAYMPKLRADIEDRTMIIPRDEGTIEDLRMIKLVRGIPLIPEGSVVTTAEGDQGKRHGDNAIALMHLSAAMADDIGPIDFHSTGPRAAPAGQMTTTTTGFGTIRRGGDTGGFHV